MNEFTGPYATAALHPQIAIYGGTAFVQVAETAEETVAFLIEQIDPEDRAGLVEDGIIPAHHTWQTSYILLPEEDDEECEGFDFHTPRTSAEWEALITQWGLDNLNSASSSITAVRERYD